MVLCSSLLYIFIFNYTAAGDILRGGFARIWHIKQENWREFLQKFRDDKMTCGGVLINKVTTTTTTTTMFTKILLPGLGFVCRTLPL